MYDKENNLLFQDNHNKKFCYGAQMAQPCAIKYHIFLESIHFSQPHTYLLSRKRSITIKNLNFY